MQGWQVVLKSSWLQIDICVCVRVGSEIDVAVADLHICSVCRGRLGTL